METRGFTPTADSTNNHHNVPAVSVIFLIRKGLKRVVLSVLDLIVTGRVVRKTISYTGGRIIVLHSPTKMNNDVLPGLTPATIGQT